MRTKILKAGFQLFLLVVIGKTSIAQIEGFAVYSEKAELDDKFGFGSFLKIGVPINQGSDEITAELGILGLDNFDFIILNFKAGYRYTFNREGDRFYFEPEAGYSMIQDYDEERRGIVASGTIGYLIPFRDGSKINVGLRSEHIFTKGITYNIVALRLSYKFSRLGRRD